MAKTRVCPHCGEPLERAVRGSYSVPADLAAYARTVAKKRNTTVSAVVAEAIKGLRTAEAKP